MALVQWCLIFKLNYIPNQIEIQAIGSSKVPLDGRIKLLSLAGDGGDWKCCCNIQDTTRQNKAWNKGKAPSCHGLDPTASHLCILQGN